MTIKHLSALAATLTASTGAFAASTLAPFTLTSTSYTQNFDTLSNGTSPSALLPAGFQISEQGSGAAADDRYVVGNGSGNGGGIYSFGSTGSTDRALGSLGSGTVSPNYFGGIFTNGTGGTINSLAFSYTGEQWRFASGTADSLTFQYLVGATAIDVGSWITVSTLEFIAPRTGATTEGAIDGNLAINQRAISNALAPISLSIAAGQSFGFRWVDQNSDGNDQGLAVDNLNITATLATTATVPEPSSWAMMIGGFGLVGAALRRRQSRATKATVLLSGDHA